MAGLVYGSSMTNPNYASYKGSNTAVYGPYIAGSSMTNPNYSSYKGSSVLGASASANTAPQNQGGGGGNSQPQQSAPQQNTQPNYGPSPDDLTNQVSNAYSDVDNVLNQRMNDLMGSKQNFLDQYTKPYDAQQPTLDQAYNQGTALTSQQLDQTRQQSSNAIADARRLFNELGQGVAQRFGGSNSAGEFANQFYGREFQRQQGQIQNTQGQNERSLQQQQADLLGKYQSQTQALQAQKAAMLAQAQDVFNQRIDAINQAKGEAAQNKAGLKLQALQELRNRAYQINDQSVAFERNLIAAHQAAMDQLKNTIALYASRAATPIGLNAYQNPVYSQINSGMPVQSPYDVNNTVGYYSYNPNKDQQVQY